MSRSILVTVIAFLYMVSGIFSLCNAWTPSSSGLIVFNFYRLLGSVLALFAGMAMFRLNELGRKLVVILLSIHVIMNFLIVVRLMLPDGDSLGIENRFGEIVYQIESPYLIQGLLLAWIIIGLLTIIFLSQKETRALFVPEVIREKEPDIIFE